MITLDSTLLNWCDHSVPLRELVAHTQYTHPHMMNTLERYAVWCVLCDKHLDVFGVCTASCTAESFKVEYIAQHCKFAGVCQIIQYLLDVDGKIFVEKAPLWHWLKIE